jgi:hypothetical protein
MRTWTPRAAKAWEDMLVSSPRTFKTYAAKTTARHASRSVETANVNWGRLDTFTGKGSLRSSAIAVGQVERTYVTKEGIITSTDSQSGPRLTCPECRQPVFDSDLLASAERLDEQKFVHRLGGCGKAMPYATLFWRNRHV